MVRREPLPTQLWLGEAVATVKPEIMIAMENLDDDRHENVIQVDPMIAVVWDDFT